MTESARQGSVAVKRVALVTGVGRREGLGFEVCRQLAESGATVVLTARDGARASELAAALAGEGREIAPLALDITSEASVAAAAELVRERYGRLDVLVNNAAHGLDAETPSLDVAIEDGRAALDTNVLGTWRMTKAFADLLRRARTRRQRLERRRLLRRRALGIPTVAHCLLRLEGGAERAHDQARGRVRRERRPRERRLSRSDCDARRRRRGRRTPRLGGRRRCLVGSDAPGRRP